MINEVMDYLNKHPEKTDIILTLEEKRRHPHGGVLYKRTESLRTLTSIRETKHDTPDVRLDVFTGEPVYTIWGEVKMIYVPIGRIDLLRTEHKESDDSKEQEVTFEYAYDNAIHTLNIQFN